MKNNNGKSFAIGALVVAVMIMAVGYAALAANLKISGTAKITSTWNVEITGITKTAGNATEVSGFPKYDGTSASFNVEFVSPGDSIEYDITVKNSGNLNAKLSSFTQTPNTTATSGIAFTVTGVTANETLAAGASKTIHVKAEWVSTDTSVPATTTANLALALNYVQAS